MRPSDLFRLLRAQRYDKKTDKLSPTSTPETRTKSYARMPQHPLPDPDNLSVGLSDTLARRTSAMRYRTNPCSMQELGTLLGTVRATPETEHHRSYPSGGGLHPLEFYVVTSLPHISNPWVYHYQPQDHTLEQLWPSTLELETAIRSFTENQPRNLLIVTARWARSEHKYHGFASYLALIESGHAVENILLCAAALNIPMRPIAGFKEDLLHAELELDPEKESVLYCVAF